MSLTYQLVQAPADVDTKQWDQLFATWRTVLNPQLTGEILVQFVSKQAMRELSNAHRNIDQPTDVLSFNYDPPLQDNEGHQIAGEIVICTDVAREHVKKVQSTLPSELATLFVHGLIHLTGLDHASITEQREFQRLTHGIMSTIGLAEVNLWSD